MQLQRELGWRTNSQYNNILLEELNNRALVGLWLTTSDREQTEGVKIGIWGADTTDYFSSVRPEENGLLNCVLGVLHQMPCGRTKKKKNPISHLGLSVRRNCTCLININHARSIIPISIEEPFFNERLLHQEHLRGNNNVCFIWRE